MHKVTLTAAAIFFILSTSSAVFAADGAEELAKSNNCVACHKVDTKGIGPSLQDIAAKNKDDADAVATLEKAIKEGSKDKYGGMAMPAQAQVSDADAKAISEWIMTMAPKSE
jgi:cytochrome c